MKIDFKLRKNENTTRNLINVIKLIKKKHRKN